MALGDIVKNVLVRLRADGAAEVKAQMKVIADQARELSKMDPTINVKVDKDAAMRLRALRYQVDALRLAGDKGALRNLAGDILALGKATDDPRVKLAALRLAVQDLGSAGGGSAAIPAGVPGLGGMSVPAAIAAVLAGLAALPFLAQLAAGALTFGLGGALVGIGVYAEHSRKSVAKQFTGLQSDMTKQFANLSPAFGEALTTILSAARTFIPQFIRDFKPALDAIAGPLKSLGVMLAGSLASPQVAASLQALGQAFGGILRALTPAVPGIMTAVSDGFTNLFRAVAKNPKAIVDVAVAIGHLIGVLLDVLAWLTQVADYLEIHFIGAWRRTRHDVAHFLDDIRHDVAHWADDLKHDFDHVTQTIMTWAHDAVRWFDDFRHRAAAIFDGFRHDVAHYWDMIWNNTIGRIQRGISDAVGWFKGMPHRILSAVSGFGHLLWSAGADLLKGLIGGITSEVGHVISTVIGVGKSIIGSITSALGIGSPSRITRQHGQWLMEGLVLGMQDRAPMVAAQAAMAARSAIPAFAGTYGGGGGWTELRVTGAESANWLALVKLIWPSLRLEVRTRGGGDPRSVQRALGQVWR